MMWMLSASSCWRFVSPGAAPRGAGGITTAAGMSLARAVSKVAGAMFIGFFPLPRFGSSECGGRRVARPMQPALLFFILLPPPSPGTLGLAECDGARARCAADRREVAVMQTVVGNAVLADEREHPLTRPVEQRIYLDQPVM